MDPTLLTDNRQLATGICDTGRYRCRYSICGQGAPLVFIHGLGEISASFLPLISILSRSFRCLSYELPWGRSDGADLQHYRHGDLVNDLFALLDHLDIAQCYLYGHSFGSTIALAAAYARPMRIARMILQGGFARRSLAPAERLMARLTRHLTGPAAQLPLSAIVFRQQIGDGLANRPTELQDFFVHTMGATPMAAMAYRALIVDNLDLRSSLPQIRQPTLLLRGDCDAVVGNCCRDDLLAGLPAARLVELPECGHFGHMSHFEIISELVREFLTPPEGGMKDEG